MRNLNKDLVISRDILGCKDIDKAISLVFTELVISVKAKVPKGFGLPMFRHRLGTVSFFLSNPVYYRERLGQ